MADTKAVAMNFLNALERISKLVEQYKAQNVTYERDIPILQQTVGNVWKKEDELKHLKIGDNGVRAQNSVRAGSA